MMAASFIVGIYPPPEVPISLAVDCTELELLAIKETSLTEVSPIQPTIDKVCVCADTKKDAFGVCIAFISSGVPIPTPVL
ncbi:hypothetical protein OkiPb00166_10630 [Escherichia coli]